MSTQQPSDKPAASPKNDKPASSSVSARRDPIPPLLLAGIFALVMAVAFVMLKDNWAANWTRYQSLKAQQNQDWDRAIVKLNKLIEDGTKMDPTKPGEYAADSATNSPTFYSELGYAHYCKGEYDKALEYYLKAQANGTNVPPDDSGKPRPPADFSTMLGLTYFRLNDLDNAERYLLAALKQGGSDDLCHFHLGEIMMKRGEYVKAANHFKTVASHPGYEESVKKYYAEIESKLFAGLEQS